MFFMYLLQKLRVFDFSYLKFFLYLILTGTTITFPIFLSIKSMLNVFYKINIFGFLFTRTIDFAYTVVLCYKMFKSDFFTFKFFEVLFYLLIGVYLPFLVLIIAHCNPFFN